MESNKVLVIGNGESRSWFKPDYINKLPRRDVTTWGCNAIYRDGVVDNLVSVDYAMQQEIYVSGYASDNQCWFSNWSRLPSQVAETFLMGYDIPESLIHIAGDPHSANECVIQGKDPHTLQEKVELAITMNPDRDVPDLIQKMEKDMGVWITHVEHEDMVTPIDFPVGWSAGSTAIHLACQKDVDELYLIGFDLSSYEEPLNNIYKGTDNYLPASSKGFNPVNWVEQLRTVFNEFQNTQFYWVDVTNTFKVGGDYFNIPDNVRYLTKTELCDRLHIH